MSRYFGNSRRLDVRLPSAMELSDSTPRLDKLLGNCELWAWRKHKIATEWILDAFWLECVLTVTVTYTNWHEALISQVTVAIHNQERIDIFKSLSIQCCTILSGLLSKCCNRSRISIKMDLQGHKCQKLSLLLSPGKRIQHWAHALCPSRMEGKRSGESQHLWLRNQEEYINR